MRKPAKKTAKKLTKRAPRSRITARSDTNPRQAVNFLPPNRQIILRYNDFNKMTSSAGSAATVQFRMNSLYDPDYTYIAHQPYLFDQISPLYNYYCVIKFTVILRYTALSNPMRVVLEPRFNNSSVTADLQAVMERNNSLNFIAVPGETGYKKYTCYLPKLAGYSSVINYKQTCGAVPSANPVVVCWLTLHAQSMDTSTTGSLLVDYEMYFDTAFEQPVQQAQS